MAKFGILTVVRQDSERRNGKAHVICRCKCGVIKSISKASLIRGLSKSCGCARDKRNRTSSLTHGMTDSPEYKSWSSMLGRCSNSNLPNFSAYGGRGIKVHEPWATSFQKFLEDLGPRPSIRHSLERKNTNGDYTPENCCWATRSQQNSNTRRSRIWTIDGIDYPTSTEAAAVHNKTPSTIIRWCNGFTQNGKRFPRRKGCTSRLKYEVAL